VAGNLSQNRQKPTSLMTSQTQKTKAKTKKIILLQTQRLAASFKRLNSGLAQSSGKL